MHLASLSIILTFSSLAAAHLQLDARHAPHRHHIAKWAPASYADPLKRQKATPTSDPDETSDGGDDGDDDISSTARTTTKGAVTTTSTTQATPSVIRSSAVVSSVTPSSAVSPVSSSSSSISPSSSIVSASSSISANSTSISSSLSSSSTVSSAVAISSAPNSAPVMTITEDGGSVKVITKIMTAEASAVASASAGGNESSGSGIGTGAVVGISVGIAAVVLALVGFAIWRMKRRGGGDDDAIRWPELNRHGDSDTHHALPARQTGHHGFETGLERSLSNSSSIYRSGAGAVSIHSHATSAAPMALNGSNFGATSTLEDYDYSEKQNMPPLPPLSYHSGGYDMEDDYANMPPMIQMPEGPSHAYGGYDSEDEGHYGAMPAGYELQQMNSSHAHSTNYHSGH